MSPASNARRPPLRTVLSLTLIVVGVVLFVSGPIVGLLVATNAGLQSALGSIQGQIKFNAKTTFEVEEGGTFYIYSSEPNLPSPDICDISVNDDEPVPIEAAPYAQNTNVGLERFESFARFELDDGAIATVRCPGPDQDLVAGRALDDDAFLDGMLGWPLAGGGLIMASGFALAVVGIVKYPRRPARQSATK